MFRNVANEVLLVDYEAGWKSGKEMAVWECGEWRLNIGLHGRAEI